MAYKMWLLCSVFWVKNNATLPYTHEAFLFIASGHILGGKVFY
jgi:hypothetical protein